MFCVFEYIYFLGEMYYAISTPLVMTENSDIFHVFWGWTLFLMGGLLKYVWLSRKCINENDILCLCCQYTDLYCQLICYMFIEKNIEFDIIHCCRCSNINCSQLLLVSRKTTGVYLTY